MRFITTGVGADGKSHVVSIEERERTGSLWHTPSVPPDLGYQRPASHDGGASGLPAGASQCTFVALAPGTATEMHSVPSYSIVTLMGGAGVLGLETGEVELSVGDVVTIPALVHQWRAGPGGCQFSSMRFGIE